MIDSIIVEDFHNKEALTYPYIGKLNEKVTMYVLFTKPRTGVLLYPGNEIKCVGTFSACWKEEDFSYTEDAVTLKNR